ncbi:uncharacterized protein LOC112538483 [Tetranychus urticae]|uniref:uncharacterized protein LOC112538483 n=1 Tax=Tetranychus urticae TaxID=32264 RepID=UPI000D643A10|nr:uncharacterized protein LOC112538483 [Tetranychus urticae]
MFNMSSMINMRTPLWTPKVTPDSTPFQTPRTLSTESLNTLHLQKSLIPPNQKPSRGELLSKRKQLKTARSLGGTPLSQRLQGTTKDFQQSRVTNRIPTAIEEELSKILKKRRQPSPDKTMDSSFEQDFSFS